AGRPFGRTREQLARLVGAARDEPVRWPQVARAAVATAIAWEAAQFLPGRQPPVFAPLAAMLTIQVTAYESLRSALQRTTGVIAEDRRDEAWPGAAAGGRRAGARALAGDLARAQEAVERVGDSVRLNPRARRARPAARLYRNELDALQHVQVQVRGIARTLAD